MEEFVKQYEEAGIGVSNKRVLMSGEPDKLIDNHNITKEVDKNK